MTIRTSYFALTGGLDLITPAIRTPVGRAIAGLNYEPHPRGYQRIDGYERFDGHPKPSDASYWVLSFDAGTAAVSEGDTVTGATSGATGVALIAGVVESGSYAGGDAAGYLVLTAVSGTFQDNENLQVSAVTKCVADATALERGATNDTDDKTWLHDAIETARTAISAIPGSGDVLGVWLYNGTTYGFRNNAGGTNAVMHKATASGWAVVPLGRELEFTSGGTYEVKEGDTITGATSGATATVTRVALETGSWAAGDAAGRLVFASQTGTFQSENLNVGANSNVATISGDAIAIELPPGGRYDFYNHNFYGAADLKRMYGANGVGNGFEFDGTSFAFIRTGMASDRPIRVCAHRNHLFFAFRGGSLQHSSLGAPYQWSVVTGAGEIGLGEEITNLLPQVAGALSIFGLNKVAVLIGDDSANWVLKELTNSAGGVPWTVQMVGTPLYLDSIGIRSMETTEAFGDFRIGTLTQLVEPIFRSKRDAGTTAVASLRVRYKDQYRLFWSDGTGLTIYFGRQPAEILPFDFDLQVKCACTGDNDKDRETLLVGDDAGMVYEVDAGTSFDGSEVDAFLRMPFNHQGSPSQKKRYTKATVEIDGGPDTKLGLTAEFGYGDPDQPAAQEQSFSVAGSGGFLNEANWDEYYWSAPVNGQAQAHIDGIGHNVSVTVISSAIYEPPHVLQGVILHYSYRGLIR